MSKPDDIVDYADPDYDDVNWETTMVAVCPCGARNLDQSRIREHQRFAHPAWRNPAITCQAAPPWDHERWCMRPVGHDGDHWTPSFSGGHSWGNGNWSVGRRQGSAG